MVRIQSLANFYIEHLFTVNCKEKTEIKKIEAGNGPFLKEVFEQSLLEVSTVYESRAKRKCHFTVYFVKGDV